jgi:outer membrane receptor protein involved in Fe transport
MLFLSTGLGLLAATSSAFAQGRAPAANANAVEEVTVTATRQTSTVNKVALSVSAVTQKNLDQQGIRSVQDLSSQVPGFTYKTSGGDNNPNLTLRGIGGNAIQGTSGGAPTTGLYLDDVPMMSRNANGLETGSGTPQPLIYDLDRIEVLRGPQGTLYGGSSEGGTIRFILPQPSLTTYSGQARVGWSTMQGGGMGNEEGLALGGPIVQDKLGFRIAGYRKDNPGWVDNFSMYDGHQFASNVNWGNDYSLRGSLLWQVSQNLKATVSVFHQMDYSNDTPGVSTSTPARIFPTATYIETGTVNGVRFSFPARVLPGFTIPAQTWLGKGNGGTTGRYLTPTDVQYVNSPRRTIFTTPSLTLDYNWNDKIDFKSITAYEDATTGGWTFTGGTSNVRPLPATSKQAITGQAPIYSNLSCNAVPGAPGAAGVGLVSGGGGLLTPILTSTCTISPAYIPQSWVGGTGNGPSDSFGYYFFNNRRGQTSQEFRIQSTDPSWRLQFVVGGFIEHAHNHVNVGSSWNEPQQTQAVLGVPEQWFQGTLAGPVLEVPTNPLLDVSTRNIDITEDEQSVFGEFTFNITSKFKITTGVRAVNYNQQFLQIYGGTVASAPAGWVGSTSSGELAHLIVDANGKPVLTAAGQQQYTTNGIETNPNTLAPFAVNYGACPTHISASNVSAAQQVAYGQAGCPYQYTYTKLKENPITPKVGLSYQLTDNDMVYFTYAEGYRPGGINPFVPPVMCATDLASLGLAQSPATYARDSVKSMEGGGKFRLFGGQVQVNAAAFHIEWDNVQFVESLPTCAFSYTTNAATAASDGAELQFTGRALGFTLNANVAYDNARYTEDTYSPGASHKLLIARGNNLGVPDWTANAGLQYDTRIMDFPAYARMDYAYTGKYTRGTGPGTNSYNVTVAPNFFNGNETHLMNARVGVYYKDLEIAGYVTNLFNSQEWLSKGEGLNSYSYGGQKQVPRVIGVQMNYRF